MSERIVAKLRRQMPKFALMVGQKSRGPPRCSKTWLPRPSRSCEAGPRGKRCAETLDAALAAKKKYADVQSLLQAIYQQSHKD